AERVFRIPRLQAAEPARLVAFVAPGLQRFAVGTELLHPAHRPLSREQSAQTVHGQEVRAGEPGTRWFRATKLPRFGTMVAPLRQKLALPRELLHAVVTLIGDEQRPVADEDDTARLVELAVARAAPAPFTRQFAVGRVDRHLVLDHE